MPVVELALDSSKSISGLNKYDRKVDQSAKKTDSAFNAMKKGALALAGVFAGVQIGQFFVDFTKQAIMAASNMEETQGKFDVVFRDMGDTAEIFAKDIADNFGLSEQASKQYLSSIQDLLVPTGLAREEAAKMSDQFVRLAADLGSFNNMDTATVVRDIQSALAGGSETMTKYGIDVKVAAVNAEMLALGLDTSTKAAERQSRTTALLSIMMRDSSDAMGDFARTQGSFANQTKTLNATLADMRAEIGEKLLPAATRMVTALNKWLTETDAINTAMLWTVKIIRFVYNGIQGLVLMGDALVVAFAYTFDFLIEGFRAILLPLDAVAKMLKYMGLIENNPFDSLTTATQNFKESSKDAFKQQYADIEKSNAAFDKLEAEIKKETETHKTGAAAAKQSQDDVTNAVDNTTQAIAEEEDQLYGYKSALEIAGMVGEEEMDNVAESTQELLNITDQTTGSVGGLEDAYYGVAEAAKEAAQASGGGGGSGGIAFSEHELLYREVFGKGFNLATDMPSLEELRRLAELKRSQSGSGSGRSSTTINVNQSVSRSDVVSIANELDRSAARR